MVQITMIHRKDIDFAYILLDDALKDITDNHDCHMSPDDGCDCHTIGYMRLDLAKIRSFLIEHEDHKKNI